MGDILLSGNMLLLHIPKTPHKLDTSQLAGCRHKRVHDSVPGLNWAMFNEPFGSNTIFVIVSMGLGVYVHVRLSH